VNFKNEEEQEEERGKSKKTAHRGQKLNKK
jgi:hypothetical protein